MGILLPLVKVSTFSGQLQNDKTLLEELILKIKPELRDSLNRLIKFIPSDGFRNIHAYALMKIIKSDNVEANFYVLADSDGYEGAERQQYVYDQILTHLPTADHRGDLKDKIRVLPQHELENLFLDYDMLENIMPELTREGFDKNIDFYKQKYAAARSVYEKSKKKKDREHLQRYFRPSLLFERITKKRKLDDIHSAYDSNEDFLEFRQKVSDAWFSLKKQGKQPIDELLKDVDCKTKDSLKEVIDFLSSIVESHVEEREKVGSQ